MSKKKNFKKKFFSFFFCFKVFKLNIQRKNAIKIKFFKKNLKILKKNHYKTIKIIPNFQAVNTDN